MIAKDTGYHRDGVTSFMPSDCSLKSRTPNRFVQLSATSPEMAGISPEWVMPFDINCEILDTTETNTLLMQRKMATFSDFIDNVSAVEALSFYEKEEQILREQFGDIEFYRRRDLCMMTARRRRKLILDVHWLNRCLQASCDKQT